MNDGQYNIELLRKENGEIVCPSCSSKMKREVKSLMSNYFNLSHYVTIMSLKRYVLTRSLLAFS